MEAVDPAGHVQEPGRDVAESGAKGVVPACRGSIGGGTVASPQGGAGSHIACVGFDASGPGKPQKVGNGEHDKAGLGSGRGGVVGTTGDS